MDEAHLDLILNELCKNGTDKVEATEEVLEKLKLQGKSMFRNDEIDYLVNQGYLLKETISGWQDGQGKYNPARYFLNLTPEGLKFVGEGGFAAKTGYAKKTLNVATQSRNWSIVGVAIALIALFLQLYSGSCSNTVKMPGATHPPMDTVFKAVTDTNKIVQDPPNVKSSPADTVNKRSVKRLPVTKKGSSSDNKN